MQNLNGKLRAFAAQLREDERSAGTIEKYLRDVRKFLSWLQPVSYTHLLCGCKKHSIGGVGMKTIVVLMDSLNRHFLPAYGNDWVKTPNIDRLAARSCVFDQHFVGSAPCMPARHDIFTGRLDFLERGWAPMQPFDCTLPYVCLLYTSHAGAARSWVYDLWRW